VTTAEYYTLEPHDRILQFASISFDVSLEEIFPSLLSGATIVLSPKEVSTSLEALSTLLEKEKLTVLNLPTAYWHEWVSELSRSNSQLPSTLRLVIVGTEQASAERLATWRSLANDHVRWINAYGPTEATITATIYDGSQMPTEAKDTRAITIGRPINNTRIYLLDKYLQPVPIGVPGELCISSISLARGYLHQPDLTNEKFIPNPFSNEPGARLYKTGDLARYLSDGNIEFLGRIDQQVKIRGFRIELGEIEAVLNRHPAVREAVVADREDASKHKQLAAYIAIHQGQEVTMNDLRNFIKDQLPDYMIPATFTFLDALPLTSSGKVDRRALPEPDTDRPELTETFVAPRNPSEKVMVDIWAGILGLERIGIYDNFFDVGGHSLLSMQLVSQVEKMFQIEIPLQNFFETPTVSGLVEVIESAKQQGSSPTMLDTSAIDFTAEAVLDEAIYTEEKPDIHQLTDPSAVFLTGATGFLGAFLLHELLSQTRADIYCLVRSSDVEEGRTRIHNTLKSYALWNARLSSRIIPIPGDLSQPHLGLSPEQFDLMARKIDVIYHNGAMVNFVYPYSTLKAPNVLGTQEILRLASHSHVKPVHYISTLSVFDSDSYAEKEIIFEHDPLDSMEGIHEGYSQSKWVAEKLVTIARSRGIPICIYRPGRISGHSQTGIWNTEDFTCKMIKGCIQLGNAPYQDVMMDLTPVDYVSSAIVYISQQQESLGQAFHLINPNSAPWNDVVNWIRSFNYPLQKVSYEQWQKDLIQRSVIQENALSPLLPLFLGPNAQEEEVEPERFSCRNTFAGIEGSSIECPPVDAALLHTYFSYFIRSHFIAPPQFGVMKEEISSFATRRAEAEGGMKFL
jgi:thioester reductase-like protein